MADPKPAFLRIEDVYKHYGPKRVLDNIDLSVQEGEFCSLVGPSGCGKSTLLRLILGQERPTSGRISIAGRPVGLPCAERGVVYQKYSLYPHLTVLENVLLGKELSTSFLGRRRLRAGHEAEAMGLLGEVGLEQHARKYPHELSGGMQQRVAVMQALIMRPRILLMDEPFGALDPSTREDLQLFLLELWQQHRMTIFFVTHDLEEAVFLGSRLLVLSQYYTDDRGDGDVNRGAKIVCDHPLKADRALYPTLEKYAQNFRELLASIREEGFDPEHRRNVREFNLRHPDSFRTLTRQESRALGSREEPDGTQEDDA